MLDGCYPVAMEYLYCVIIMCLINLKQQDEARETLMKAWNMAKPDGFLEPFIFFVKISVMSEYINSIGAKP